MNTLCGRFLPYCMVITTLHTESLPAINVYVKILMVKSLKADYVSTLKNRTRREFYGNFYHT